MKLTWYGHGTWLIENSGKRIILDPFFDENPASPVKADEVDADLILVSHGHFDHVADVASIANRCNAKVLAIYEIASWFAEKHSVADTVGMNIGGQFEWESMNFKMTPASHSSTLPDGSSGGVAAGFLVQANEKNIYFACDTAFFGDMDYVAAPGLDLAVVPIGDLFTMGIQDSIEAIKATNPKQVAPAHYNTWPPIEQDVNEWAELVKSKTNSEPITIQPGESFEI